MRDTRRSRLLLVILVAVAFLLITLDFRSSEGIFVGLRSGVSSVAGRLEKGLSTLASPITNTLSSLANADKDKKRADQLSQQLAQANQQLAQQQDALRQTGALSRLRLVADKGGYAIVPARIVATDDQLGLEWSVTVDAGSDAGVRPGMLVINSDGLVGSTVRVGARPRSCGWPATRRVTSVPVWRAARRWESGRGAARQAAVHALRRGPAAAGG